uniref:Uncharacterized protein n=1 Tax=Triticum urartu TaxID=4572 RepID=A0A8R7PPC6_TRIUA
KKLTTSSVFTAKEASHRLQRPRHGATRFPRPILLASLRSPFLRPPPSLLPPQSPPPQHATTPLALGYHLPSTPLLSPWPPPTSTTRRPAPSWPRPPTRSSPRRRIPSRAAPTGSPSSWASRSPPLPAPSRVKAGTLGSSPASAATTNSAAATSKSVRAPRPQISLDFGSGFVVGVGIDRNRCLRFFYRARFWRKSYNFLGILVTLTMRSL